MDAKSQAALVKARKLFNRAEELLETELKRLAKKVVAHPEIEQFLGGNGSWCFYRQSDGSSISDWDRDCSRYYPDGSGIDPNWLPKRVWKDIAAFEYLANEYYELLNLCVSFDVTK